MLIPWTCLSSSEMGAITRIPDSRHFSGMEYVGLLRCSISPGSKSFFRKLSSCKVSSHVPKSSNHSRPPDRRRWLRSIHDLNETTYVSPNKVVSQKLTVESGVEALPTRAINPCKSMMVLAVVLSTALGSTDARAGVESTFQPKFSGLVDASTNKVSSVEAILAKQLARRFREMSDEELILVLQELLKASRSSISPEDIVLDGRGHKDYLLDDGIKEENRKPIEDAPKIQDPLPLSKQAAEAGQPELSAPSSKFVDSVPKNVTQNSSKPTDGTDRASKREGGREGFEMSAPGSKSVDPAPKPEKSVLPGTGRAPSFSRETASEEALKVKKSGSSANAKEEGDEVELSSERSEEIGESNSQDMTGILWGEWKRRLGDQTILAPTESEESSTVSIAAEVWQKMQTSSMRVLREASDFSVWISDKREAVTGGVLAYGSIALVLFIRQKILGLSSGEGNKNEAELKVDETRTKAQLSTPDMKDSGQDPWSFLQAVPAFVKAARNRLLGSNESSVQVEKASSGSVASPNSSGGSTMTVLNDVALNGDSGPATGQSGDLDRRQAARETLTGTIQNSSYASKPSRLSEQLPDRFVNRTSDRQTERGSSGTRTRFKAGVQIGDAVYESALDDLRALESADLQGKGGKEDDEALGIPQFPQSTSAIVDDSREMLESPALEETKTRYFADDLPLTRTRGSPLTPNTKGESSSAGKSFGRSIQGIKVGKRTELVSREKVELAPSERGRNNAEYGNFDSRFLQNDSTNQTRDSDVEVNSVSESTNKPFFWLSSRPKQLDPLAYRRKSPAKEVDTVESQSRVASASVFPDEMKGGVGSRKSASSKSISFLAERSDRIDGENGGASSSLQLAQGEEVPFNSVGPDVSPRSRKSFSPVNGGSNRREDYGLGTEPPQKTPTDDLLGTRRRKQNPAPDDPEITDNKSTFVRETDQFNLPSKAELGEYAGASQADSGSGAANFMDTRTRGFDVQKATGQSSGSDVRYSVAEEIRVGESVIIKSSVESPDSAPELLPKRESLEASEEEWVGEVSETPASSEQAATPGISQEMIHERMTSPATSETRLLESEAVRSNDETVRASASNADAANTDRGDMWASSANHPHGAEGFEHPYNNTTIEKLEEFGASSGAGKEFRTNITGQSGSQLDSFFHKQNFWVRDSDGVFIKHPRESQGKVLQVRGVSRASDSVRDLKYEAVDASVAPKTAKKANRDSYPTGGTRLQKQKRGISSGFDYRQLYLRSKDDSNTPGQQYESKTSSGSKRPSGSLDTGKTWPIRYGVERTR